MERFSIIYKQDELSSKRYLQIKSKLAQTMTYDESNPELVITIGGDGTVLDAVHRYAHQLDKTYFVGVHSGTLGFYTDYNEDEWEVLVEDILKDEWKVDRRNMLEVRTNNHVYYALNEMRVEENHRTMVCDIYINGEYLERFRGNGLCVSTPSGSTALNRSLGGAIVAASIPSLQLSEIVGIHHNAYRSLQSSLVLDASTTITFVPQSSRSTILGVDRDVIPFDNQNEKIEISVPNKYVSFIRYRHRGLCTRLRKAFINE